MDVNNIIKNDLEPKSDLSFQMIFICVKYGTKYNAIYVNNLYNALKLHTFDYYTNRSNVSDECVGMYKDGDNKFNEGYSTSSSNRDETKSKSRFRFICYTEDPTGLCGGVEVQLLPNATDQNTRANNKNGTDNNEIINTNTNTSDGIDHSYNGKNNDNAHKINNNRNNDNLKCNSLSMKNWKGWWIKAYLFYAVQFLIPRNTTSKKSEHKIETKSTEGSESSKRDDCASILPIWICYLDLDTVICNNIDFIFDLIQKRYDSTHSTYKSDCDGSVDDSSNDKNKNESANGENGNMKNNNESDNNRESRVDDSRSNEIHNEDMFYTLSASSFLSEGRPCGMNSSIMLWSLHSYSYPYSSIEYNQNNKDDIIIRTNGIKVSDDDYKDHISNQYINLYYFLLYNYDIITKYIYKFDHYLEMMLLHPTYLSPSSPHNKNDDNADKNPSVNNDLDRESDNKESPPLSYDHVDNKVTKIDNNYNDNNDANNYFDINVNKSATKDVRETSYSIPPNSLSSSYISPILIPPDVTPPIDVSHIIPQNTSLHDAPPNGTSPHETSPIISPYTSPLSSSSSKLSNTNTENLNPSPSLSLQYSINHTNIKINPQDVVSNSISKFESSLIKVYYLQDMAICRDRIIDYSNLLSKLDPALNDQMRVNSDVLSSEANFDLLNIQAQNTKNLLANISIVCFPLSPKPHEVGKESPWVKNLWEGLSI
jgi:hypothetical protein